MIKSKTIIITIKAKAKRKTKKIY